MKHLFTPLIRLTCLLLTTAASLLLAQSPVTYIGTDPNGTQGAWTGSYGSDGYIIADYVNAAPSYAVLTPASSPYQPSGTTLYPWAGPGNISYLPVGLQIAPGSSQAIASQIYSSTSFNINIALSGGKTRQIALYLLDFDSSGRAETISFLDGSTNTVLDTEHFSSFSNGLWARWKVQASVTNLVIQVTNNSSSSNATISGIFFDTPASTPPASQTITFNSIQSQTVGTPLTLGATASSTLPVTYVSSTSSVCTVSGSTASFIAAGTCTITASQAGNSSYAAATPVTQSFTVSAGSSGGGGGSGGSPVTYKGTDPNGTQGAWTGSYGSDGYIIADYVNAPPSYAVLTPASSPYQPSGTTLYPWAGPGNISYLPVGLQVAPGSSQAIASQIYSSTSFNINIALSGGKTRQISLYLLDFDSTTRAETITFLDGSTNEPLAAPQSFSSFNNGVWAIWQVQGSVTNLVIQVTNNNSSSNATISGIFFDTPASNSPAPQTITFNSIQAQTVGTPLALGAAASSTLPVTYVSSTSSVCTVSGSTASFIAAGTCTITASQAGNSSYAAATPVTQSFTVSAGSSGGGGGGGGSGGSPVTYKGTDPNGTQGAWTGSYGSDGYIIADYVNAPPSYAVLTPASSPYQPSGASLYPWTQQPVARTYSPVSLQIAAGSSQGVATQIYSSTSFNINIALSGGRTRQISLYLLDFDSSGRAETISFIDGSTNTVLDTEHFSSFSNGLWARWQVQGSVTNLVIQVTNNSSSSNATISGIFFDTITSNSSAPPPNTLGPQVTVFTSANQWVSQLLSGSAGSASAAVNGAPGVSALGDYDGDGLVDAVTFLNGAFSVVQLSSTGASFPNTIGTAGDIAVPGDYDGDGKTDFAVFRPSTGSWYYAPSRSGGSPVQIQTSALSTDVPAPGDYDGDGITDAVYYRSSNAVFYFTLSTAPNSPQYLLLGIPGDVAIPGDYDGDGITDFALFRPSNGVWYYRLSTNQTVVRAQPFPGTQSGDVPVPGDYDGDGKTDFAMWRPSNQTWYVILSSNLTQTLTIPATGSSSAATPVSLTPFTKARAASLTVHQTPGSYYTISGEICLTTGQVNNQIVCPAQGTSQLTGVTVTLGGSSSQQMLTDSNGSYSFTVPANGTYTVTPSLAGYTFAAATTPNLSNLMGNPLVSFLANAVVGSTPQTITFPAISAQTIGASLSLSASATSGLAVTFASSTAGVCTVSGTTASFIAAGTCNIQASQAGNSTYAAATTVSRSFTVSATPPSTYQITGRVVLGGSGPSANTGVPNVTLTLSNGQSATSAADGSYSFTVNTTGSYTLTASYPSSSHYTLSGSLTVSIAASNTTYPGNNFTATFTSGGSFAASSPDKEYIFLNGAIVAVEHPH